MTETQVKNVSFIQWLRSYEFSVDFYVFCFIVNVDCWSDSRVR